MSNPIQLGERVRIEAPNLRLPEGAEKQDVMAWTSFKMQRSGKKMNVLKVGTRHMHFAQVRPSMHSRLHELVSFKSTQGLNLARHSSMSSGVDDVLRYGVTCTLRCMTGSKAGGRFLSPNNDNFMAWDRHAEALRSTIHSRKSSMSNLGGRRESIDLEDSDAVLHRESFKVIHVLATNMRKDWQEDAGASGEALVPSSRFALVSEFLQDSGKPCYVSAMPDGNLCFVPDLGPQCVFAVQRVDLEKTLEADALLCQTPTVRDDDESGAKSMHVEVPDEFIECQTWGGGLNRQWVARKGKNMHFTTVEGKPISGLDTLPAWWTADGLGHFRVEAIPDNEAMEADPEGWMYGSSWKDMFRASEPEIHEASHKSNSSRYSHRIRKWVRLDSHEHKVWKRDLKTAAGEDTVPHYRCPTAEDSQDLSSPEGEEKISTTDRTPEWKSGRGSAVGLTSGTSGMIAQQDANSMSEEGAIELAYRSVAMENGGGELTVEQVRQMGHLDAETLQRFEEQHTNKDDTVSLEEFKDLSRGSDLISFLDVQSSSRNSLADQPQTSLLWAGQALLPAADSWKGRVLVTTKLDQSRNITDFALSKKLVDLSQSKSVPSGELEKDGESKEASETKHNAVEEDAQDNPEADVEVDDPSDGRPCAFCYVEVSVSEKTLKIRNDSEKGITFTIDLKERGWYVETVHDPVVAERSLDVIERRKKQAEFDDAVAQIEALQEERKNSPNKRAKDRLTEKISGFIDTKILGQDQMKGRPPAQGWMRLVTTINENGKFQELVFSPVETRSAFVSSANESERGKRQNYQSNLELCRQCIIDSMPDTPAMRESMTNDLLRVQKKLASMKQFTTENSAADLFKQFSSETEGMAEIDQRIEGYQKKQREILLRIQDKINEVEAGNLSAKLADGLREWVTDIQNSEKASEEAAKKGLEMLTEQIYGLEQCSNDIIDAAKKQALLTLQYGVPYIPDGTDEWRKKLESGEANKTLMNLTSKITAQVATVTGVPQTVVNAAVESKTGTNPGGGAADQMKNALGLKKEGGDPKPSTDAEVEMVTVEVKDSDEVKEVDGSDTDKEEAEGNGITDEQAALLEEFRPPKQPEEYKSENHKLCFILMCGLCCVNIILAIVISTLPGLN